MFRSNRGHLKVAATVGRRPLLRLSGSRVNQELRNTLRPSDWMIRTSEECQLIQECWSSLC
jgi:hypothetical protein